MFKVASLWENTTKDGKKYLAGNWGDMKVMIFPNTYKTEERHPDYTLHIAEREKRDTPRFEDSRGTSAKTFAPREQVAFHNDARDNDDSVL